MGRGQDRTRHVGVQDLSMNCYGGFYQGFLLRLAPLTHEHAEAVVDAVLAGIGGARTYAS